VSRIPDEIIQQVRDRIDVVELVGRSVSLKRAGRNYKGLCPFHHEKTPSFNVNPDRGTFYCFGCHEGGDAFAFVQKTEGLGFLDAVRSLARDCGVVIPESGGGGGSSGLSERIYEANALLLERHRAELKQPGCPGAAYLAERGLAPEDWDRFEIGFAPDRWDFAVGVLRAARIPMELGETAGILSPRQSGGHYDRLRGRVVFPIRDARGRVLGFGGRALSKEQEPKYLNTPETPVFHKREALYGLPKALEPIRRADQAVVVEGYFDQIALCRAGVEGALATNGTALTPDHARALLRRAKNVVVLFDGDAAGERALARALEILLPEGLRVRAAEMPPKEDPDSLLRTQGPDALRAVIEAAVPALDLIIDRAARPGHESPWQKADAVAAVAPLLARVPTALDRAEYCARLAMAVGTETRHVEAAVRAAERGEDAREAVPAGPRRSGPEERNLRQLARCLVEHPELASRVDRDELAELVPAGAYRELIAALVDAADERPEAAAAELAASLDGDARMLFHALSVEGDALSRELAARTIDDTFEWLRDQQRRRVERDITRRLRSSELHPDEKRQLLEERQRLLHERQRAGAKTAVPASAGPPA
jgi:DNA primase